MQGGKQPTAAQKKLWGELLELGCIVTGGHAELHHMYGSTAKFNKQPIGNWAVLALNDGPHRNWPNNFTTNRKAFFDTYRKQWGDKSLTDRDCEKIFYEMQKKRYELHYQKPFPVDEEILKAIQDYRK